MLSTVLVYTNTLYFPQRLKNLKMMIILCQGAKKVVSNSLGLVDFAIGVVNSVFNLPDGQVMFFEKFE